MKGFFGALCIFLLWTAACIYYVSTNELESPKTSPEQSFKEIMDDVNTVDSEIVQEPIASPTNASIAVLDTISDSLPSQETNSAPDNNNISRTESQLLADELLKSIAISDTIDFARDEPEISFENTIDIAAGPSVINRNFYPYYKNTDLIIDQKLVDYVKEIRKLLRDDPSRKITIIGHTDNVGNARDNFNIGLKKSRQVKWYLTARRGLPRNKIKAISLGEEEPIDSNASQRGRNKNNRVEIIIE